MHLQSSSLWQSTDQGPRLLSQDNPVTLSYGQLATCKKLSGLLVFFKLNQPQLFLGVLSQHITILPLLIGTTCW